MNKTIKLKVVNTENNKQERLVRINIIISISLLLILLPISLIFNFIKPEYITIVFFISLIGPFLIRWKYKRYKIIGEISLSTNRILFNTSNSNIELSINKNSKLLLYYRGAKGEMFDVAFAGIGIFGYKDGSDNFLEYTNIETGEILLFNIFFEKEEQLKGITIIFSEIKKSGIKCKIKREDFKLKKHIVDNKQAFDWKVKELINNE